LALVRDAGFDAAGLGPPSPHNNHWINVLRGRYRVDRVADQVDEDRLHLDGVTAELGQLGCQLELERHRAPLPPSLTRRGRGP
jgi:hypothetical protein